jgi:hypothetical protein
LDTSSQKQKEQRQKQLVVSFSDVFSLPFECFAFFQVFLPVKENAEIETGMAETSIWDQANIRQS